MFWTEHCYKNSSHPFLDRKIFINSYEDLNLSFYNFIFFQAIWKIINWTPTKKNWRDHPFWDFGKLSIVHPVGATAVAAEVTPLLVRWKLNKKFMISRYVGIRLKFVFWQADYWFTWPPYNFLRWKNESQILKQNFFLLYQDGPRWAQGAGHIYLFLRMFFLTLQVSHFPDVEVLVHTT